MNFSESYEYLLALGNEVLAMKLGLDNIRKLLAGLGNPQKNYLKVQIAGTNGKGSTCAFLEAICCSARINVGVTTSPHLVSVTERIKIGGREIGENEFARLATIVRETSENLVESGKLETVPTYFEQVTAIALLAFADAGAELAILETGLGGRFDATTAANAEIGAITPVDYDHQQFLGETLAEIASEKAAIIRENMPFVLANQKAEAEKVILDRCREMNVSPIMGNCAVVEENSALNIKTENAVYSKISLGLKGEHQRENACTAINLAEILISKFNFKISHQNIVEGLERAKHPGRLEWREFGGASFLFDGAHNASGAKALKNYLRKYCADSKIIFLFGVMRDKNTTEIAAELFPLANRLILTEPDNPRALAVSELKKIAEKFVDQSDIMSFPKPADALEAARRIFLNDSGRKHVFVCVTGSLYLVGEAQKILAQTVI